nr:MAG TPA: hypothetical protein [Caudoviricetes sp.]
MCGFAVSLNLLPIKIPILRHFYISLKCQK